MESGFDGDMSDEGQSAGVTLQTEESGTEKQEAKKSLNIFAFSWADVTLSRPSDMDVGMLSVDLDSPW